MNETKQQAAARRAAMADKIYGLSELAENTAVEIRQGYSTRKRKKIILPALKKAANLTR